MLYMNLPHDDYMLLSYINTKLRDEYSSLREFCDDCDVSAEDICARLGRIGYEYDPTVNAFR